MSVFDEILSFMLLVVYNEQLSKKNIPKDVIFLNFLDSTDLKVERTVFRRNEASTKAKILAKRTDPKAVVIDTRFHVSRMLATGL